MIIRDKEREETEEKEALESMIEIEEVEKDIAVHVLVKKVVVIHQEIDIRRVGKK